MSMRGVRQPGVKTITTRFTGALEEDASYRDRFLQMVHRRAAADGAARRSAGPIAVSKPQPPFRCSPPRHARRVEDGHASSAQVRRRRSDPRDRHRCRVRRGADVRLDERRGARPHARDARGHFWSRSRGRLWKKGEESGNLLRVVEMRTDCDQDALWLKVERRGDGRRLSHRAQRSCFYRSLPLGARPAAALRRCASSTQSDSSTRRVRLPSADAAREP